MLPANVSPRALAASSAVVLGGLLVLIFVPGWPRWLAAATVLTAIPVPWRTIIRAKWWIQRRPRWPIVLLLALLVLLLSPLLRGEPPASRDHGIHYFQIHLLVDELLPSGRLWGWSPSLNHGYPYGESYPVLGYLWMAAAHLLSFGAIPLRTSYAWGLAALWMLSAAVAWWLAAMVTRELQSKDAGEHPDRAEPPEPNDPPEPPENRDDAPPREATEAADVTDAADTTDTPGRPPGLTSAEIAGWAGLVAAALWLLDPGASRQGGWSYLMFHGVWPQLLAATLWAASLGLTWRAFADPRPRRLALAALALGASLWAHPFGLLTAACSTGAWLVLILVGRHRWPGPWRTWAVIHGAGVLLGMGWLATFFGSAGSMARAPVPWVPLAQIGTELARGQLMMGHWIWVAPLGLWGAVAVVRRGRAGLGWIVLGLAVVQLVLASEDAITVLRLDLVHSGFKNLQFPRYAISFKPLWFALGGIGLGRLLAWHRTRRGPVRPLDMSRAAWVRRGVAALVLAPLLATLGPEAGRLIARPIAAIDTLSSHEQHQTEAAMLAALREELERLPPGPPPAVAVMRKGMSGATYPIMTVADAGARLVLDEHIPTVNFKHRVRRRPAAYEGLGVTHVIHDRPVPKEESGLAASLTEVERFGPFALERFTPPHDSPRRIAELEGFGLVQVQVQEPERLELLVTEVDPGTTLIIGRAPHVRWEITHDGELLEFEEVRLDARGTAGMAVTLPGPGQVTLRYRRSDFERRAVWLSAAMLVLCLASLLVGGPPLAEQPAGPRTRRIAWIGVAVLGPLAVAALVVRQQAMLTQTWTELGAAKLDPDPDDDQSPTLVRDLVLDGALRLELSPTRVCNGLMGKDVLDGCSEVAHRPHDSFLYRNPYLYRCWRISVPAHGQAVVHFPSLPDDDHAIIGSIIRHVRKGSGKKLFFGSRSIQQRMLNRRHDFVLDRQSRTIAGHPVLGLRNEDKRIEEICLSAALMRRPGR